MRMTEIAFRDMRNKAAKLADAAHTGQTYGGDKPYTFHLRMVADNVLKWGTIYLPYGASRGCGHCSVAARLPRGLHQA
jgi:(p)ppGpp synthase/HD superfamily hydrolase